MARISVRARGFATNQIKMLVAGALALAAVVLAVRAIIPDRSERTDVRKPSVVRADGSVQAAPERRRGPGRTELADIGDIGWNTSDDDNAREFAFEKLGNAKNVAQVFDSAGQAIDLIGGQKPGLGEAVAELLIPVAGGEGSMGEAVASLGGNDSVPTIVAETLISSVLEGASIDTSNLIVREPATPPRAVGGLSVNRSRNQFDREDGEPGVDVETTTLSTSFENHFPDAMGEDAKGDLAEILIPFRCKGSDSETPDLTLRLVMRYVKPGNQWQPAAADIITTEPSMMQTAMNAVRTAVEELNASQGG